MWPSGRSGCAWRPVLYWTSARLNASRAAAESPRSCATRTHSLKRISPTRPRESVLGRRGTRGFELGVSPRVLLLSQIKALVLQREIAVFNQRLPHVCSGDRLRLLSPILRSRCVQRTFVAAPRPLEQSFAGPRVVGVDRHLGAIQVYVAERIQCRGVAGICLEGSHQLPLRVVHTPCQPVRFGKIGEEIR